MVEFLFFRHGETDWNLQRIFQGHTDIPLNSTGQFQAEDLGRRVQDWGPDLILCSDLTRAIQTAQACQPYWNAPLIQSSDLREMNLGRAEGLHRDEVQNLVGPGWEKWVSHHPADEDFRFPEGESKAEARARVLSFLENFVRQNPSVKRIAVSTHGGVLRRVTHALPGTPVDGVPIPNCVSYRLRLENGNWSFVPVRERASVVVRAEDRVLSFFAVDPSSGQEYHFLPGGVIEANETPLQCAERECREETGYEATVVPDNFEVREYDFVWNSQPVWCRTHFLKGNLTDLNQTPKVVRDAAYNKGVVWIPETSVEKHFAYHPSILKPIRLLLQRS